MSDEWDPKELGIDAIRIDDLLGDPELLAELHSMGWSEHAHGAAASDPDLQSSSEVHRRVVTDAICGPSIATAQSVHEIPPELDESQIRLDDADLHDEELLAMYEQLSVGREPVSRPTKPPRPPAAQTIASPIEQTTRAPVVTVASSSASQSAKGAATPAGALVTTAPGGRSVDGVSPEDAKRRAVEAKRLGNTEEALYWFRVSKQMAASGGLPAAVGGAAAQPHRLQGDPNFVALEAALAEASRLALAEAKALRESDPPAAVAKMREYKRYEQELGTARARRTVPGAKAPAFRWTTTQKRVSLERLELAEDELRVQVDGVFEIDALLKEHKVKELWAEVSVGSAGKESDLGSCRTAAAKYDTTSRSATWRFQTSFAVVKRTKVAQNTMLRKKLTLKLVGQKAGVLWSSSIDLALATLPLSELAAVSEAGGRTPLYQIASVEDGAAKKGKAVGGYVVATMQVRKPLSGADVRVVEERQLVVEPWPPLPDSTAAQQPSSSASSSEVAAAEAPSASRDYSGGLTERECKDPDAVDFLESNDVLEAEIEAVTQVVQSGTLDEDAQFNATLRLQLLQVKMQTLVMKVQNEVLTMDDYLQLIKDRMQRDKQIALYLSRNVGDAEAKALAIKVMRRVKIMQQEIDNAESGGDGGES